VHVLDYGSPVAAIAEWKSGAGTAMLVIEQPNPVHAALIGAGAQEFLAADCF